MIKKWSWGYSNTGIATQRGYEIPNLGDTQKLTQHGTQQCAPAEAALSWRIRLDLSGSVKSLQIRI